MLHKKVRVRLSEREKAVVTSAQFFAPYKKELQALFEVLGKQDEWSDDPRQMLGYLRARWIGREHGNSSQKDQFSEAQRTAAMPYFEMLGLTSEDLPDITNSHLDQMIIMGGLNPINYRRLSFGLELLRNSSATVDTIVFCLGERPRYPGDGSSEDILGINGHNPGGDVRENPWVKELFAQGAFADSPSYNLNETDMGRITMLRLLGNSLMPYRVEKDTVNPTRQVKDYYFKTSSGQEIVLVNGAAVYRGNNRVQRPTSKSCSIEWLERHAPKNHAKVLYVADNPSLIRMTMDTYSVLRDAGREDIELIPAGPAPFKTQHIHTYLGEIARLIDKDVRRNYI